MNGMMTRYLWTDGNRSHTLTVNFPPQWTHAYIALSKTGGGAALAGIISYRYRLPSGADETVVLTPPDQGASPSEIAHDNVTSITFEVWTFEGFGYATCVLTFW